MSGDYFSLASGNFSQDWSDGTLIGTNDDWSSVPSILGYRTGDVTTSTGVDARTIVTDTGFNLHVIANQNPTATSGGVLEVDPASNPAFDRTIAMQGSNGNDFAAIVINLNAAGRQNLHFTANVRDLDASGDNAAQQVVVQYRIGGAGDWINLHYEADVTTAGSATQVTPLSITLPAAANDQTQVQIRILTVNAAGNDELVGIDDIVVTSDALAVADRPGAFSIDDASVGEGHAGTSEITFTVTRGSDSNVAASVDYAITLPGGVGGASASDFVSPVLSGTLSFGANEFSKTITLQVAGDTADEPNETFTVTLSNPTGGATIADATGTGTILNDDAAAAPGTPFVNEIHYDNAGTDSGEAIEIAAPAGTDLGGWQLVLYSVSSGATQGTVYNTINLSGIVPNQDDGYGTLTFVLPTNGLQNGPQDGFALVNPQGQVVQFLSYEGAFTAQNGPAAGLTSTDIGVSEDSGSAAGFSLQLVGSGANAQDFTWTSARPGSFGSVNADQDFIGPDATGQVRVLDASISEGDAGTRQLVFTVTRGGGLGQEASLDWFLNLNGSADQADLGAGQPLAGTIEFGVGVSTVHIAVTIQGDTIGEDNETFNLLLANPVGNIAIVDGTAVGTILNDDPIDLATYQIQGAGHASEYVGQVVRTTGIVTAVDTNGFYLQDPDGDGNAATSDALFVFTGSAPAVAVGDAVEVSGRVSEFLGGNDASNLTVTQLSASAPPVVISHDNDLPDAILIGTGGILPPTETIDDDGLATFDPQNDGIDFYESLEGMRVTIDAPLVVASTNEFGETDIVASGGVGATGVNSRGGITISPGDYNPEKIQIDDDSGLFAGFDPAFTQGDRLGNVTGVVSYSFNNYEVLVTEAVTVTQDVTLGQEVATIDGDVDNLSIASMNVENLSPEDSPEKFDLLASNIVYNLSAPDIIAVQEVQDGNGVGGTDPLSGQASAQGLIDAILEAGGPRYVYVEIAPSAAGETGGAAGGNIRNGFFYNPDRVSLVEGGLSLIDGPAFQGTRRPLVGTFEFNGQQVSVVNVHFTARIGSDPLWGSSQPPANAGDDAREAQADAVAAYVNDRLATDPSLKLLVAGDYNGFYFEDSLASLHETGVFTNLYSLLPEEERYSYLFGGNLQPLDNMVVTNGLLAGARFDVVHVNAEQPDALRNSDHDQLLATFHIPDPNDAPVAADDAVAVDEDAASDNLWDLLLGNDSDPDAGATLSIQSVDGTGTLGTLVFDAATQTLRYVADHDSFDALAPGETVIDRFDYTITDEDGLTSTATVEVTVTGVDDGEVRIGTPGPDRIETGAGEDQLYGLKGDDILIGGDGHDLLVGDRGGDQLFGGDGNDVLISGLGNDRLYGGDGGDTFVFSRDGGADFVFDFDVEEDRIRLDDLEIRYVRVRDFDGDGRLDLNIAFRTPDGTRAGGVNLYGVDDFSKVQFEGEAQPTFAAALQFETLLQFDPLLQNEMPLVPSQPLI